MKLRILVNPSPLKCWQHPWGFHRLRYVGADKSHPRRGWQFGLGIIGFEYWATA